MSTAMRSGAALVRGLALGLFACALVLRLLIPAGWMPSGNGFAITLCSGMGPMTPPGTMAAMAMGHHHGKGKSGDHDHAPDTTCPYASLRLALDLPVLPGPSTATTVAAYVFVFVARAGLTGLGLAAPPPAQTGPPTSS